jgi:two-component system sensor histidine kinase VanS
MKVRFFGIFGKVFFYTCLILISVVSIFFALFAGQINTAVTITQQRQLGEVFQPLLTSMQGKTDDEIIKIAEEFHEENRSFNFCFEDADGRALYQTENYVKPENFEGLSKPGGVLFKANQSAGEWFSFSAIGGGSGRSLFLTLKVDDKTLYISGPLFAASVFEEIRGEVLLAFALIFLVSLIAAAIFARRIAKPIRTLTHNTRKMAQLEEAPPFPARKDEIGQLATDVYSMHQNLKDTIRQLEKEIRREKEMEENQRYFFSAASHELKTPIAATEAILEGIIEDVIPVEEYPQYARECMKLMHQQNKLVSEILDIVKLSSGSPLQDKRRVNLRKTLEDTLSTFTPIADAKEQQITLQVDGEITLTLNEKLFQKALSNILLNAIQNSPHGSEIKIYTEDISGKNRLCVWNGNAAIPDALHSKLFNPFVRVDAARTSSEQKRSGLGLTIVKKALDLMKIPFSIQNFDGGVLFWMELPKH